MKKLIFTLTTAAMLCNVAKAQDSDVKKSADAVDAKMVKDNSTMNEGWTKNGTLGLTFNHASNQNWYTAPESPVFLGNANLGYSAYMKKGKTVWLNDLSYKLSEQSSPSTNKELRKGMDQLLLSSMYAREIKPKWYYAGSFDLNTELLNSYSYAAADTFGHIAKTKTSSFMTTGNIRAGLGIMYKPNTNFRVYFSPLTANIITKLDKDFKNVPMNVVKAGETVHFGLGALLRADYFNQFSKNASYKSRLDIFTDYTDHPFSKNDIDWTNRLTFKATKFVGVIFDLNFRYHEAENTKIQYIENLGIGFNYTF